MVLFVLALLLASCGDDDSGDVSASGGDDPPAADVTFEDLEGRSFASSSVTGYELVDGTTVDLTFAEGRISAVAGCNTQNGDADVVDNTLEVGPLASTMMGCEDPNQAQDVWLAELLEGGPEVALDGETLTLTSGEVVLELTEAT